MDEAETIDVAPLDEQLDKMDCEARIKMLEERLSTTSTDAARSKLFCMQVRDDLNELMVGYEGLKEERERYGSFQALFSCVTHLAESMTQLKKSVCDSQARQEQSEKEVEKKLATSFDKLNEKLTNYQADFTSRLNELRHVSEERVAVVDTRLTTYQADFTSRLNEKLQSHADSIDTRLTTYQADFTSRLNQLRHVSEERVAVVNDSFLKVHEDVERLRTGNAEALQQSEQEMVKRFSHLVDSNTLSDVRRSITQVQERFSAQAATSMNKHVVALRRKECFTSWTTFLKKRRILRAQERALGSLLSSTSSGNMRLAFRRWHGTAIAARDRKRALNLRYCLAMATQKGGKHFLMKSYFTKWQSRAEASVRVNRKRKLALTALGTFAPLLRRMYYSKWLKWLGMNRRKRNALKSLEFMGSVGQRRAAFLKWLSFARWRSKRSKHRDLCRCMIALVPNSTFVEEQRRKEYWIKWKLFISMKRAQKQSSSNTTPQNVTSVVSEQRYTVIMKEVNQLKDEFARFCHRSADTYSGSSRPQRVRKGGSSLAKYITNIENGVSSVVDVLFFLQEWVEYVDGALENSVERLDEHQEWISWVDGEIRRTQRVVRPSFR